MIDAKIIADSKNEYGNRITTMIVTMPRFILAEFNTHRMFSRNSASSRAIPFEKMVKSIEETPFIPIAWQKDHKGMQGNEYFTNEVDILACQSSWGNAKRSAIAYATSLNSLGATKQLANRLLEPFMYHTVIVTATEWENFFALRCPQYEITENGYTEGSIQPFQKSFVRSRKEAINRSIDDLTNYNEIDWLKLNKGQAEIHMMALAEAMWDAYNESIPKLLQIGEYHIPFGDNISHENLSEQLYHLGGTDDQLRVKIATARCARVSYTVVGEEGKPDNYENDIKLYNRLVESKHASPFEHIAQASDSLDRSRNFTGGWKQYREIINL